MKKRLSNLIPIILVLLLVVGCSGQVGKAGVDGKNGTNGLNGTNGIDGTSGINGIDGKNGINGLNGKDGLTPFIGDNGNWWIGTTDSGVKASSGTSDYIFKSLTLSEDLVGAVQKGPFISGTSINFYELDQSFVQTGFSYSTRTTDNVGNFSLRKGLKLSSNNLLFVAQGFYYNEVSGQNSEVPLTMYLVSDISDQTKVNINLLTSLEYERIMYLIENGASYSEASSQARSEIMKMFYVIKPDIASSQDLDITEEGDDNAILLAISVILQGYRTTSELSQLLAEIGNDIKEDGKLDSEKIKTKLINDAKLLDLSKIRENLETFYYENNITVTVPNFEYYVNQFISNNASSSNPYVFTKYITYPSLGLYGANLLDKNFTEMSESDFQSDVMPTYSIAAELPIGTRLKAIFTSITPNNSVYVTNSLNNSKWTIDISYACNPEDIPSGSGADGCPGTYTVVYNSNNNYGVLDVQTSVGYAGPNDLPYTSYDMFRVDYYENGSLTPTYSKIIKMNRQPE